MNKAESIATECVYRIATGVWQPGDRLPSLREAASQWRVDQATIQGAYRRLESMGLAQSVPKSGSYVLENATVRRVGSHAPAMESLFERVSGEIEAETDLSVLGTLRYLTRMAEERSARAPECVVVECTEYQARQLADYVGENLNLPCDAFSLDRLARESLPAHVRVVGTTGFHLKELDGLVDPSVARQRLIVRFSADVAQRAGRLESRVSLFCLDAEQGTHVASDVRELCDSAPPKVDVHAASPGDIDTRLVRLFESDPQAAVILSPSLWSAVTEAWRQHERVLAYEYEVDRHSIEALGNALGLPLGLMA